MRTEERERTTRDIVEQHLASRESEWHQDEPNVYHASRVWNCFRKAFYKKRGEEGEDVPLGLFAMGARAEDVLFEALRDHFGDAFVLTDVPVKEDVETEHGNIAIVGRTDPVVIGYNGEFLRLYEVKSSESWSTGRDDAGSAKPTHTHQAAFYAAKLGIDDVHIPRPGRSDVLEMPSPDFVIPSGDVPELYRETVEYFVRLHEYVARDELPDPEPRHEKECEWCDVQSLCQAEDDGAEGWVRVKAGNHKETWRSPLEDVKENDTVLQPEAATDE
jgi:hypothetical protein